MTPKDFAVRDIKEELKKQNKSFLAFHNELNPTIRGIVLSQIKEQVSITNPLNMPKRSKSQLVARCFFCDGQVSYSNYSRYYEDNLK